MFGFGKGIDVLAARREKKEQQAAFEAEQKARKQALEGKETDAIRFGTFKGNNQIREQDSLKEGSKLKSCFYKLQSIESLTAPLGHLLSYSIINNTRIFTFEIGDFIFSHFYMSSHLYNIYTATLYGINFVLIYAEILS